MQKKKSNESIVVNGKFPVRLRGLNGICQLFGVSKSTAIKYSKGILKDAITRQGSVMLINTKKALELFGCQHPEDFIQGDNNV